MIKCFIVAALTADGFLAKDKNQVSTSWNSADDKKHFVELTKRAGVVVLGSTTFETFGKPLKDRVNIVYSRSKNYEGVEMTNDEPEILLKKLEERSFSEVAICGGSSIYTKFLKAGVVDTLYITVEPILFGKGITLFNDDLEFKLELISEKHTPGGTIFKEYKILK